MSNYVINALADTKVAIATAAGTAASGTATWIPKDIGLLASLIGIIATIIASIVIIDRRIHARKKDKLEIELLERQINSL